MVLKLLVLDEFFDAGEKLDLPRIATILFQKNT
jgi:hypothetical protein